MVRRLGNANIMTRSAWGNGTMSFVFSSLDICSEQALGKEQLGVEDGGARRAANGVVTQRHEAMAQDAVPRDPTDGEAHAAARVAIQPRLRAIGLVAHEDPAGRRGVETQLLRHAPAPRERVAQLPRLG